MKLQLHAGQGGAGKTRLLLEVCERLERTSEWRAGFASRSQSSGLYDLLQEDKKCLIVLDYAECRTSEIIEIIRMVLATPNTPAVRLVLLARDGGDWWDHLDRAAKGEDPIVKLLNRPTAKTGPYRMTKELVEKQERNIVFNEALHDFATSLNLSVQTVPSLDLSNDPFGNPLFIHLAALATLRGKPSVDDKALLNMLLAHERSYWRQLLDGEKISDQALPAMQQALALLTLCGGKRTAKEAKGLVGRAPKFRALEGAIQVKIFDVLRRLYPLEEGLTGLQPDLLGETLVSEELGRDE